MSLEWRGKPRWLRLLLKKPVVGLADAPEMPSAARLLPPKASSRSKGVVAVVLAEDGCRWIIACIKLAAAGSANEGDLAETVDRSPGPARGIKTQIFDEGDEDFTRNTIQPCVVMRDFEPRIQRYNFGKGRVGWGIAI